VYNKKDISTRRKAINSHSVFIVKWNADGSVEYYKARVIINGYLQIVSIDYEELFTPITTYDSLYVVMALAINLDLLLEQLDIKIAFLNSDLIEEI